MARSHDYGATDVITDAATEGDNDEDEEVTDEKVTDDTLYQFEEIVAKRNGQLTKHNVSVMRSFLRYYFMSPVEKWTKHRKFPYKLTLEMIKVIVVTLQLCTYGIDRTSNLRFEAKNSDALRHIFQPTFPTQYHEQLCDHCVEFYTRDQVYTSIDNMINSYYDINEIAIGNFLPDFDPVLNDTTPFVLEIVSLNVSSVTDNGNLSFVLDTTQVSERVTFPRGSSSKFIDLKKFVEIKFDFFLYGIAYGRILMNRRASCIELRVWGHYSNEDITGLVIQHFHVSTYFKDDCDGTVIFDGDRSSALILRYFIISGVILVSIGSIILSVRSVIRNERLRRVIIQFFAIKYNRKLRWNRGSSEFFDFFLFLVILADGLLIVGSIFWLVLLSSTTTDIFEGTAIILGSGTFFCWCSLLRYLNYNQKLSILLLTITKALPDVMRFLLCAMVLFAGFLFFGWIVLGPYTAKFDSISTTAEQLFSLINGDEMFATFQSISTEQPVKIWLISRIYFYSFIALYIYVVLSLFIAIISDAYEAIKETSTTERHRPLSPILRKFLAGKLEKLGESEAHRQSNLRSRTSTQVELRDRSSSTNTNSPMTEVSSL